MSLHAVFFAIDWLAIFSAVLLAISLLVAEPRSVSSRLTALILANVAGYLVFSRAMFSGWIPEPFQLVVNDSVLVILQIAMNTTAGLFMVLCFELFKENEARFPRWLIVLLVVQLALEDLLPFLLGVTTHPSRELTMTDTNAALYFVFETLPATLQMLFIGAALYWTVKEWRVDLVATRRAMRTLVIIVAGVHLVSHTLVMRLLLSTDDIRMLYVHEAYTVLIPLMVVAVMVASFEPRRIERSALVQPDDPPDGDSAAEMDYARFLAAMDQHIYREAGITTASLAVRLKIPEYRLRRLINTRLGYRNFNQMLHTYRIQEACVALTDPEQRRLPILTIALTVGYQSINPFNRAFRELKGTTPSAFRQRSMSAAQAQVEPLENGSGVRPAD